MNPNDPLDPLAHLLSNLSSEEREAMIRSLSDLGATPDPEASPPPAGAATEIVCVVDRSGSMGAIRDDAVGGFNQFLDEQRRLPGEARLTLALFDHEYDPVHVAAPLADVRPLDESSYVPRGTTALFDAIGRTLATAAERIAADPAEPRVIVCILTDGMENASTEYSADAVRALIEARREAGWAFVFLAADQDALHAARAMSIPAADAAAFAATGSGVRAAYAHVSERVARYRTTL